MTDNTDKPTLKSRLAALTFTPLSALDVNTIPEDTCIAILRHEGKCAYIGESDNLRRRIRQYIGTGQAISNSPIRKLLCVHLHLASPEEVRSGQMDKRTRTVERLDAWISKCEAAWLPCDLADLIDTKNDAIKHLKPFLNKP